MEIELYKGVGSQLEKEKDFESLLQQHISYEILKSENVEGYKVRRRIFFLVKQQHYVAS